MADESFQERTEQPTPKRIKEARDRGQVARSVELNSVVVMLAAAASLMALGPMMSHSSKDMFIWIFNNSTRFALDANSAPGFLAQVGWIFIKICTPTVLALVVVALAVSYLQVGNVFSVQALEPKFEKLNVISGLKNLVSLKSMVAATRDIIKLIMISVIAYYAIKKEIPTMIGFTDMGVAEITGAMVAITLKISFKILLALAVIALLDFLYQKWDYTKGLKMSFQDLKEELKQTEGNPQIKGRVRAIQREQARKRMMQDVPKADVVITNPTHIAVALKYDTDTMDAPTLLAKGERLIAEAIKKIARESGIPVVENKPLARAIFKSVEVGMQIPADLYKAVAEVLAYVYNVNKKANR